MVREGYHICVYNMHEGCCVKVTRSEAKRSKRASTYSAAGIALLGVAVEADTALGAR